MPLPLQDYLEALHRRFRGLDDGAVASYIPELANANPDWFGICVATVDGHLYSVGDAAQGFTIQSISKPFVYAAALADRGREHVLGKVGVEPSGDAFNSISLDPQTGAPKNPMINAGAIATTALVAGATPDEQWQRIAATLSGFAGRALTVDQAVYRSESETGFRNRAIAWMLRNFGISGGDPMPSLENYFRQCALEVTCADLALMAATLANGGVHPVTAARAMPAGEVEAVLSVMSTCGMYDYAGSWLYEVGMPAKSGVGGGIIAVLPGRFGIAIFSPRLDEKGNSARGIAVCRQLSRDFGLHVFGEGQRPAPPISRSYSGAELPSRRVRAAADAALLAPRAAAIAYLELQGDIAMDGAERIVRLIDGWCGEKDCFILDLHRLSHLTPSAARMLRRCRQQLDAAGKTMVLSRPAGQANLRDLLGSDPAAGDAGFLVFEDNDRAAEWCENRILDALRPAGQAAPAPDLARCALFDALPARALAALDAIMASVEYAAGQTVLTAGGEDDDRVFFVVTGEVSVLQPLPGGGHQRLATLGPGGVFGEMALLGQRRRSATVHADQGVVCRTLSSRDFDRLARDYPQLKIGVLHNLAAELAGKLRQANQLVRVLAA